MIKNGRRQNRYKPPAVSFYKIFVVHLLQSHTSETTP